MQDSWGIELEVPKEIFCKKLKEFTYPMDLDTINESIQGGKSWFMNVLKQDYKAINHAENKRIDIFYDLEKPCNKIFAGELIDDRALLYLPFAYKEKSWDDGFAMEVLDQDAKVCLEALNKESKYLPIYAYETTPFSALDRDRSFAYQVYISGDQITKLQISKIFLKNANKNAVERIFPRRTFLKGMSIQSILIGIIFLIAINFRTFLSNYLSQQMIWKITVFFSSLWFLSWFVDMIFSYFSVVKRSESYEKLRDKAFLACLRSVSKF